jgi:hypothetical protein
MVKDAPMAPGLLSQDQFNHMFEPRSKTKKHEFTMEHDMQTQMYVSAYGTSQVPQELMEKKSTDLFVGKKKFLKDDKLKREHQVNSWIKQYERERANRGHHGIEGTQIRHERVDEALLAQAFEAICTVTTETDEDRGGYIKHCSGHDAITVLRACGCAMLLKEEEELLQDLGDRCSFLELKNVMTQRNKMFLEAAWQEAACARGLTGFDNASRFDQLREAFLIMLDSAGEVDTITGEEMQAFLNAQGEHRSDSFEEVFSGLDKNRDWKHSPLDIALMLNLMKDMYAKVDRGESVPHWVALETKEEFTRSLKRRRRRSHKEERRGNRRHRR